MLVATVLLGPASRQLIIGVGTGCQLAGRHTHIIHPSIHIHTDWSESQSVCQARPVWFGSVWLCLSLSLPTARRRLPAISGGPFPPCISKASASRSLFSTQRLSFPTTPSPIFCFHPRRLHNPVNFSSPYFPSSLPILLRSKPTGLTGLA